MTADEKVMGPDILKGFETTWVRCGFGTVEDLDATETLGQLFDGVEATTKKGLLAIHPLAPIIVAGMRQVREEIDAIERLGDTKPALLHVRQVEEVVTVLGFLVKDPAKYNEFRWRWDAFPAIEGIRIRLFNRKKSLDEAMNTWIAANLSRLQEVDKRLKGDVAKDEEIWKTYSNWLYKIPLLKVFEAVGRAESYYHIWYEWGSHSVHFSPLRDRFAGFELREGLTYFDIAREAVSGQAIALLHFVAPAVEDPEVLRRLALRHVLKSYYHLLKDQPSRFQRIADRHSDLAAFAVAAVDGEPCDKLIDRAVARVSDPLVVGGHSVGDRDD